MLFNEQDSCVWTEKYRPEELKDVIGQENIMTVIENFVKKKYIPNILFAGPAGVGKSTIALVIAKKIFGDNWTENFLETNASDERGIDVIRNKIKNFAKIKSISVSIPKICMLDEADALTREAQQALRRTMEKYVNNVRFILTVNYSSNIIEPIQSRCAIFRFRRVEDKIIIPRLKFIAEKEDLKINDEAINIICDLSNGDVRKAINIFNNS